MLAISALRQGQTHPSCSAKAHPTFSAKTRGKPSFHFIRTWLSFSLPWPRVMCQPTIGGPTTRNDPSHALREFGMTFHDPIFTFYYLYYQNIDFEYRRVKPDHRLDLISFQIFRPDIKQSISQTHWPRITASYHLSSSRCSAKDHSHTSNSLDSNQADLPPLLPMSPQKLHQVYIVYRSPLITLFHFSKTNIKVNNSFHMLL